MNLEPMNLIALDKNNLHHAYLIEGDRDVVTLELLKFIESLGIATKGNPDFYNISVDSFKIDDARNLKTYSTEKSFSGAKNAKKIFIISANNILLEAQNSLLKIFEEPIENTHFFVIVPHTNALLKTFLSRFYVISLKSGLENNEALKFLNMPLKNKLDFVKELLVEVELEEGIEENSVDSIRTKALKFLNELESALHEKMSKRHFDTQIFEHIFKVRESLRMPGSSPKTLLESVALMIPDFKN